MTSDGPNGPRIVVTGMGAVTNLGLGARATWEAMRAGRSGVTRIEAPWFERFRDRWMVTCAGQARAFVAAEHFDAREARKLDRFAQMGLVAAKEAVEHSGVDFGACDLDRCGVVIGSGIGGIMTIEEGSEVMLLRGPDRISPFTVPRLMVNAATGNISIKYGLRGPASTHATACASSGHAFADGMGYLRRGLADVMIVGGAEAAVSPLCIGAFMTMRALSPHDGDPAQASRPFDRSRDGFVLAEGAAMFVIETLDHARKRGADILAELLGHANSSDATHITAPDAAGRGAARSMVWALRDAGLDPTDIDYVNSHGTATPLGDRAEVEAVLSVFGDHARKSTGGRLLMSSTKSMHGHCLGASGAVETIACIGAVREGVVAPTINLNDPDDGFDLDMVPLVARESPVRRVMNNTFGFGGHNVTIVLGRFEG